MAKSTHLHPQFFHTLIPGFHSHLMIPLDFFSKYIQGRSVENTAVLKSDSSGITWKVKITGRRLIDGWREFAVAHSFQIGDVVLVRYEGNMVFHVSDCCEIPSKKHSHPRTDVGDDEDLPKTKKVKTNSNETELDSSSCFVATVTAFDLLTDTLYLPQHFTRSNGLTRKYHKIVLIDGGKRSWALDLLFNESSDAFYMTRGWTSFCEENGQEAGGFFTFKLVGNGETIVLSFCPTESYSDQSQRDYSEASRRESFSTELSSEEENIEGESSEYECSSTESLTEIEKKKCNPKRRAVSYSSYSPSHKQFVTFTLPPDYVTLLRLSLPKLFLRENGINKPGEIYLLGKDGTKWPTSLLRDNKGIMSLGKGWKDFVQENRLESGFTLKLKWEDTTPVFSLCCPESISDKEQEEYFKAIKKQSLFKHPSNRVQISKYENKKEECIKQFVTLTITPSSVRQCRLRLLKNFTRENGINKPGMITLLGRDGIKHQARLLLDKVKGIMDLGSGWIGFAEANGLKMGDSFTLKLIWEDTTPVLRLCPSECSIDRGTGEESSEERQKTSIPIEEDNIEETSIEESIQRDHMRCKDSSSPSQNRFVTITIRPDILRCNRMRLPNQFVTENGLNKPGMIYLLGEDDTKWMANLVKEKDGRMKLGNGWKVFAEANDFKPGESVTLESICEDGTPMIRFLRSGSKSSKANKKESISMEDTEPRESDSSSAIQDDRFVTLTQTPEEVRAGMLILPSQFLKANGINKLGKIPILGENKMETSAYLLSWDGVVCLENDWNEFCEANGVKLGESFTLEFINEQDRTTHVLKLCSC